MGIIIFGAALYMFFLKWKKQYKILRYAPFIVLLVFFISGIAMNVFQEEVQGWQYGIATARGVAGTDFLYHYEAAEDLANGVSLSDLGNIATRFTFSLSNIGYFVYAVFLRIVLFTPMIINRQVSLAICYGIQVVAAIYVCSNIADYISAFLKSDARGYRITWWILVSCISVFQVSNVLMRDVWIFFLLSVFMKLLTRKKIQHVLCIALLIVIALLRSYTIIITLPLYAYAINRRVAYIGNVCITVLIVGGSVVLRNAVKLFNVLWEVSYDIQIGEFLQFLLFPNIFNQTGNLINNPDFAYRAGAGSNHTTIYYILALWNIIIVPLAIVGGVQAIRKRRWDIVGIWWVMLINVACLYAIVYGGISEPRHKLMILPALAAAATYALKSTKPKTLTLCFAGIISIAAFLLIINVL